MTVVLFTRSLSRGKVRDGLTVASQERKKGGLMGLLGAPALPRSYSSQLKVRGSPLASVTKTRLPVTRGRDSPMARRTSPSTRRRSMARRR